MFISKRMKTFIIVAEEGSLIKASDRLCMTTPPICRMIKQIESDMGKKLFIRSSTGFTLTHVGKQLYEKLLPAYNEINNMLKDIDSREKKIFSIGRNFSYNIFPDQLYTWLISKRDFIFDIQDIEKIDPELDIILSFTKDENKDFYNFLECKFDILLYYYNIVKGSNNIESIKNLPILWGERDMPEYLFNDVIIRLKEYNFTNKVRKINSTLIRNQILEDGKGIVLLPHFNYLDFSKGLKKEFSNMKRFNTNIKGTFYIYLNKRIPTNVYQEFNSFISFNNQLKQSAIINAC